MLGRAVFVLSMTLMCLGLSRVFQFYEDWIELFETWDKAQNTRIVAAFKARMKTN